MSRKLLPLEQRGNLTLAEAKRYAGVGHKKAKDLIAKGHWRAMKLGREIRVIKTSIDDWQEAEASKPLGEASPDLSRPLITLEASEI